MKPKVCLIRCPAITMPQPPDLGLAYIGAVLKNAAYPVKVLDLNWELYYARPPETPSPWDGYDDDALEKFGADLFRNHLPQIAARIDELARDGFNVFGLSVWASNKTSSLALARTIKARHPASVVIFGGPECMPRWSGEAFAAEPALDAVVYGEGEETVLEILRSIEESGAVRPAPGCYARESGKMRNGGPRPSPVFSALPIPDFNDYDLSLNNGRLGITFTRGCAHRCRFCSLTGYIAHLKTRPAEHIFFEIKQRLERHRVRCFEERCPSVSSNLPELKKVCEMIVSHRLKFTWTGQCVFHPNLSYDLLGLMHRAGCHHLVFGLESGSQKVTDLMGRGYRLTDAENNLRDLKKAGIHVTLNVLVGYPGETEEDFRETLRFLEKNRDHIDSLGAVSTLWISPYALVANQTERLNIIAPQGNIYGRSWRTKDDSNTPEIREDRRNRLLQRAGSLNLVSPAHLHVLQTSETSHSKTPK